MTMRPAATAFALTKRRSFAHCLRSTACSAALVFSSVEAQAPVDLRVALVIGNSEYPSAPLVNPANDAHAIAEVLSSMGFQVIEIRNASRAQMKAAIDRTATVLKGRHGVGLLYFAGHGLQLDWRNYIVPIDGRLTAAADVPSQAIDVHLVLESFKAAGNRMNIVVLDACRDNPFGALSSGKGLAQMDAPSSTLLAYATAPGNVAEDGDATSGHGLYTQFLLQELKSPPAKIEDVFKRVRLQVRQRSNGRQIPWESTSLEEDFYFDGSAPPSAGAGERQRAAEFERQKSEWDTIKNSTAAAPLYAFLQRYPTGAMAELAQARLERIDLSKVTTQPNQFGEIQTPASRRFRLGDRYHFVLKDGFTDVERIRFTAQVDRVDTEIATYSGLFGPGTKGASTLAGAVIDDGSSTYDPPLVLIPGGEYQVGKHWSGRAIRTVRSGQRRWFEYSGRVVDRERITVPAGEFDAYRIEFESLDEDGERRKTQIWADPDWGLALKLVYQSRRPSGAGDYVVREVLARERSR